MQWKTVVKSEDILSFKATNRGLKLMLEARRLEGEKWGVIKRYFDKNELNFTEEFSADSQASLLYLLKKLKESNYSHDELKNIESLKFNKVNINPTRKYKEYNTEKWHFTINDDPTENTVIIRYNDTVEVDLFLFERFQCVEEKTLGMLKKTFGLEEFDFELDFNIHYFTTKKKRKFSVKKDLNWLLDAIELDERAEGDN